MNYKYCSVLIMICLLTGCLTEVVLPPLVPAYGKLVIFDGDKVSQGKGFALPRGLSEYSVSYERPFANKTHLSFDLKFDQGWTGCGWNWNAWNGEGNNIKDFKTLVFYMAVSPCPISDITFQLTSKNKAGGPDGMGPKISLLPGVNKRGKYIKFTIPVEKLIGESLDETSVWGFNIGVFSSKPSKTGTARNNKSGSCKIYIDNIEFVK